MIDIDVWSDVVCPWCYIGKRHLETALAEYAQRDDAVDVAVRWHSYELDPQAPKTREGTYVDALATKFGRPAGEVETMLGDMTARAAGVGLDYHFDIAKHANTFDAHRLLHLAAVHGVQDALKESLFRAVFTEGRTVSDPATLRELAVEVGLDGDLVDKTLAGDGYADEVRADIEQAADYGISGVPFFVFDRRLAVSGAQPAEVLLQALDRATSESTV
jgi:predicted DsbA family dithiol-disulfide isomerase